MCLSAIAYNASKKVSSGLVTDENYKWHSASSTWSTRNFGVQNHPAVARPCGLNIHNSVYLVV